MTEIAQKIADELKKVSYDWSSMQQSHPNEIAVATLKELLTQLKIEYEIEEDVEDWCIDVNDILRIIEELEEL